MVMYTNLRKNGNLLDLSTGEYYYYIYYFVSSPRQVSYVNVSFSGPKSVKEFL